MNTVAPSSYTVKSGDTLGAIAARNGTSVSEIMKANPQLKNPNSIGVGQQLKMPGSGSGGGATQGGGSGGAPQAPTPQQRPPSLENKPEEQSGNAVQGEIFPFWVKPTADWKTRPRYFGSPRSNGRKHGGVDLYAPVGTKIRAIADGRILRGPYYFYDGTYALEVVHPGIGVVRYGEIKAKLAPGVGKDVKAGQHIAFVGDLTSLSISMLHFELYKESAKNDSTLSGGGPFRRNAKLIDPTPLIDRLFKKTFG
ncbi:LysM peptidoglycan-binding domain-containing protein [Polyangium aurulentum]|uniref:LysM peptidoglycan-binding domain-containing protein n=1 Tax=Polyangium aurulentum TaxID=2567896 RepID=UPI001F215ABF|nr:LysM peptidoglycan-binding domain-containing protein [Polyangium aurulentum]